MPRKLKVFQARLGFYDTVVAAPSQAAALRAWGTHHNLFADGMAELATDESAIAAALRQPDTPLKRAIGTSDAFGLDPGLPVLPEEPRATRAGGKATRAKPQPARETKPAPRPTPKPADRAALDRAEAALRRLDEDRRRDEQAFRDAEAALRAQEQALAQRRSVLEGQQAKKARSHAAARRKAETSVEREAEAYRKAGGR